METTPTNHEQKEFWNQNAAERWVALQEMLDAQLDAFGKAAIVPLDLAPGARVLDVGCGCGGTSLELAARVGPEGAVLGVDISRPMLALATTRAASAGLANLRFVEADAQSVVLEEAPFDALFSRFGVMFFADPTAAFANLARALRPGAKLGFVCWRALADNPFMHEPLVGVGEVVALPPPSPPGSPGPFAFAEAERVREILEGAGYRDVVLEPADIELHVGNTTDLDEASRSVLGMGPAAAALRIAEADAETIERARVAVRERLRPYLGPRGVVMSGRVWIVRAIRP